MSITDKMRQLNPRVESKVAPIDKIQSILRELTVTPHYQQKGVHNPFSTLDINVEKERISLGIKHLSSDPIQDFIEKHPLKSKISGKVTEIDE